jgi:hypothetical protein
MVTKLLNKAKKLRKNKFYTQIDNIGINLKSKN